MRIRLKFHLGPTRVGLPLMFQSGAARQPSAWLPFFGSLAAHTVLIGGLALLPSQLGYYLADDVDWSAFTVEPIKVRIPERIFYVPERKSAASRSATVHRQGTSLPSGAHAPQQAIARRANSTPKGLELPHLDNADSEIAILQPDPARKPVTAGRQLPSLAFWARRDPLAPKPPRAEITLPGRVELPGTTPVMAETPTVAVPNLAANAGPSNISPSAAASSPSVAIPSAATAPIRDEKSNARTGVFDWIAGDAANVIIVSPNSERPGTVVDVPAGSQAPRDQGVGEYQSGGNQNAATSQRGPGVRASADASSDRQGIGPGPSNGADSRSRFAVEPPEVKTPGSDRRGAEAFTRIMHPPDGNFDLVVMQSGEKTEVADGAPGLSGSPIYSVYLRVGDECEWVLKFCLPPARGSRNSRYEVYVEAAEPISAPYPLKTTIPNSMIGELRSTPLTFHGFITSAGLFRDMKPTRPGRTAQELAATLDQWQFRPAMKNRLPVDVEVLVILPAGKRSWLDMANNTHVDHSETIRRGALVRRPSPSREKQ